MFPPPPNPVASTEHGCRDSRLPAVPHTENAEEEGGRVVLGMSELSNVYTTTPPVPQNLKTLLLKQQAQAVNDRIPAKGCRHLLVKPLGKWHGKGKHVSAVRGHHQRQGRDHWNQQVGPEETGERRGQASFQPDGGGTHRTGSGAGRGRRSQAIAGGSSCGGANSPEQCEWDKRTSRSVRTGQKKRLLGGKKTKAMWERWYVAILDEEKLQSSKDITMQYVEFCEATTS